MRVMSIAALTALNILHLAALPAGAQTRPVMGPVEPVTSSSPPAAASEPRLTARPAPAVAERDGMLERWEVGGNAVVGIGRYSVGTIARPRSNMERERMMERENRAIAGAGLRLRF